MGEVSVDNKRQKLREYFHERGDRHPKDVKTYSELEQNSIRDPLTGLYNRRYLTNNLPKIIEGTYRTGTKLAVVMIDIDYFKKINDQHGHLAGDSTLKKFADILRDYFPERQGDNTSVVRYGGEEYVLITQYSDPISFRQRLERVRAFLHTRDANAKYHDSNQKKFIEYTASFGLAFLNQGEKEGADQILKRADDALYQSKQTGRDKITVAK